MSLLFHSSMKTNVPDAPVRVQRLSFEEEEQLLASETASGQRRVKRPITRLIPRPLDIQHYDEHLLPADGDEESA